MKKSAFSFLASALVMLATSLLAQPAAVSAAEPTVSQALAQATKKLDAEHPTLPIGSAMPDYALMGTDDKIHTPAEFADKKLLVVMFLTNHCPVSQLYEGRAKKLYHEFANKGVGFVAIQPDDVRGTLLREYHHSDLDDTLAGMKIAVTHRQFPFPYLDDGETQVAVNKFGPKATPHFFIFDQERKLRFEGRVDDNMEEAKAKTHEVRDAIEALLAGKPVPVAHTAVFGCSIKWTGKSEVVAKDNKLWEARPVTLESVTLEGLTKLRTNPTDKYVMINFWATWCAPCRIEYPDLLDVHRWYNDRDFDFVSISADSPANREQVLKFLKETHSGIRNLQVDTTDVYAMQKAFDPTWESALPFTVVLAPGGKVIYRKEGEVDILELRRALLRNLPGYTFLPNLEYWGNSMKNVRQRTKQ